MAFVILIILAALIAAFFYLIRRSPHKKRTAAKKAAIPKQSAPPLQKAPLSSIRIDMLTEDHEWLKQRWKMAEEHRNTGDRSIFPDWYFDEMTKLQQEWLEKENIPVTQPLTKGQASDLIDLNHPPGDAQLEILKFFRVRLPGDINHTRALHEISLLFKYPEKREAWNQRPASELQKEKAVFFGIKLPEGASSGLADQLISERLPALEEKDDPRVDHWDSIENIVRQLWDQEALKEVYLIKKPGMEVIITALEELKNEGRSYVELEDNIELVVEKLVELNPGLKHSPSAV